MENVYNDYEAVEYYLNHIVELEEMLEDVFTNLPTRLRLDVLQGTLSQDEKDFVYKSLLDHTVNTVVTDLGFIEDWTVEDPDDPEIRHICVEWLAGVQV